VQRGGLISYEAVYTSSRLVTPRASCLVEVHRLVLNTTQYCNAPTVLVPRTLFTPSAIYKRTLTARLDVAEIEKHSVEKLPRCSLCRAVTTLPGKTAAPIERGDRETGCECLAVMPTTV
jgi:hypothetical protein